jgi:hypothetical protein
VSARRFQQVRFDRDDRARSVYQYVPFEVPVGSSGVAISYRYERQDAVIDLGLFDPDGFRGWSGGARDVAVITTDAATPGYLPGPLPPGEWSVVLGLHRVPVDGVMVTVEVDTASGPPPPTGPSPPRVERPPRRQLPAAPGRRWVAADLHTHTQHSDGKLTIGELAALGAGRGVEVLAVTDHNTVSHHPHLAAEGHHAGLHLLPGQEVTTAQGHANCFGAVGWIDFREPPDRWLAEAERRGAVLSINHPVAGDCAWTFPEVPPAPLIEAWHWTWDRRSLDALRWFQRHRAFAVGGSDFHDHGSGGLPGQPTTWIELPEDPDALDDAAVLAAIRTGASTISAEPRGPCLVRAEGELVACAAEGLALVGPDGGRQPVRNSRVRFRSDEGLHLLVDDDELVHALSA